jgi:ribosomal protein S18 acetylase RimI-like enzyme
LPEVTRLDERDAEQAHELLKTTWRETYAGLLPETIISSAEKVWHSTDTLRRQMKNRTVFFAGCKDDGELVALVRAADAGDGTIRVFQLYVLPSWQRRGLGTLLLDHVKEQFPKATKMVLEVAVGNDNAISFYRKYGFSFPRETTMDIDGYQIRNVEATLDL